MKPVELRWPLWVSLVLILGWPPMLALRWLVPMTPGDEWAWRLCAAFGVFSIALGIALIGLRYRASDEGIESSWLGRRRKQLRWSEVTAIKCAFGNPYLDLIFRSPTAMVRVPSLEGCGAVAVFALLHVAPAVIESGKNVRKVLEEWRRHLVGP